MSSNFELHGRAGVKIRSIGVWKRRHPLLEYDPVVLADDPKAFWPLNTLEAVSYGTVDSLILANSPKAFWKFDAFASGPDLRIDEEDFNAAGSLTSDSTDIRGISWAAHGSAVFTEGSGAVRLSTGPIAWGNGDIAYTDQLISSGVLDTTVDCAAIDAGHGCGVCFRVGSSGVNGYNAIIYRSSIGGQRSFYVERVVSGVVTQIKTGGAGQPDFGTAVVNIIVDMKSSDCTAYVVGPTGIVLDYFQWTDSTFTLNTRHGIMGFQGPNTSNYIKNWKFYDHPA